MWKSTSSIDMSDVEISKRAAHRSAVTGRLNADAHRLFDSLINPQIGPLRLRPIRESASGPLADKARAAAIAREALIKECGQIYRLIVDRLGPLAANYQEAVLDENRIGCAMQSEYQTDKRKSNSNEAGPGPKRQAIAALRPLAPPVASPPVASPPVASPPVAAPSATLQASEHFVELTCLLKERYIASGPSTLLSLFQSMGTEYFDGEFDRKLASCLFDRFKELPKERQIDTISMMKRLVQPPDLEKMAADASRMIAEGEGSFRRLPLIFSGEMLLAAERSQLEIIDCCKRRLVSIKSDLSSRSKRAVEVDRLSLFRF